MDSRIISAGRANTSYTQEAKEISQGKSTTRVHLTSTDSTAYDVAAKTISKSLYDKVFAFLAVSSKKYIEVSINNQKVLLNVNSVAKRLHIAKKDVLSESKNDNFLDTLSKKAAFTEKVLKNYNEILSSHFSPENGDATPLTKETIMKVIHSTLQKELGSGTEVMVGTKPLIARHQEEGKVNLLFIEKQIGTGGTAKIFSADNDTVYKLPNRSMGSAENNRKEAQIVNKLNENDSHDGIVLPMHLVECLTLQKNSNNEPGILMPKYDHDYSAICPTASQPLTSLGHSELLTISSEFEKLLSGLGFMHSEGILHGDIKPENILQKGERTDIIDFGEARDIQNTKNLIPDGISAIYNHSNDMVARINEIDTNNNPNRIITIEKARDVFALGSTFFRRFQEGFPFKETAFFGYQEGLERNTLPDFVPKALTTLIDGMTHPDLDQRLSAPEAFAQLKSYQTVLIKLPELKAEQENLIKEMNILMGSNYFLGSKEKVQQEIEVLNKKISQEANPAQLPLLTLKRDQLVAELPKCLPEQEKARRRVEVQKIKGELAKVNEELHLIK